VRGGDHNDTLEADRKKYVDGLEAFLKMTEGK
jgi:hypothetical protein